MSDRLETYREKMGEFEKARREVEKVRKEAIEELLAQRREVTKQLRQLGYEGDGEAQAQRGKREFSDDGAPAEADAISSVFLAATETTMANGHKRRRLKGAKSFESAYCSICQLGGHDLRAHRGQDQKRAFSAFELRSKGLASEVHA